MKNPFLRFDPHATGFSRENARALAHASLLSYSDKVECERTAFKWGFTCRFYEQEDTQAILLERIDCQVLAFRGTESIADVVTDLVFLKEEGPLGGRVHSGFLSAFNVLWDHPEGPRYDVERIFRRPRETRLFLTGHSLGGALSQICAASLAEYMHFPSSVYTFGSPRVGDGRFANALNGRIKDNLFRIENNNDAVVRNPPWLFNYCHAGKRAHINVWGDVILNASWWYRLKDRILGRLQDFGRPGTDGIGDHLSRSYIEKLGG